MSTETIVETKPVAVTKPGYKTTEFWLTGAASLLGILFASGVVSDGGPLAKVLGLAVTLLGTLGYAVARTKAKSAS